MEDLKGLLFNEKGNKKITGQQGVIPFILSQLGDIIIKAKTQKLVKKIKNFLLILAIIF
tara:strand:- start:219 stop:395 length:177 start_codon:yes stop_codon:yes gene_type:complete